MVKLAPVFQHFWRRHFRASIYELVLGSIWVGLWAASAAPLFNFNLGFMRVGVTYVWPILMGLTLRAPLALLLAVVGDNLALVTSGTGFSQWMPEYAVIYPVIVIMSALSRHFLLGRGIRSTALACLGLNLVALGALLAVLILQSHFQNTSRSADGFFNFTSLTARALVWTMFAFVVSVNFGLAMLSFISPRRAWLQNHQAQIRRYWAVGTMIFGVIVVTMWLWGPFAQIRYLTLWGNPATNYYRQYELFLIPRVLKTPLSLVLYAALIVPLYAAHEQITRRRAAATRW